MFENNVVFGIDIPLEAEGISTITTRQNVICRNRLIRIERQRAGIERSVVFTHPPVRPIDQLPNFGFTSVRRANNDIIASPAIHDIKAMSAIEDIVAIFTM